MSFDFFNTSLLAFGSKLTSVFKTLNNSAQYAIDNLNIALSDLDYYNQYINRNYRVPTPTREGMAARTNEIFALIDESVLIKEMKVENNLFSVEITFFTTSTNRMTNAIGSTELKEGYAFVVPADSNNRATRNIRFSSTSDERGSEILLFQFRIDSSNNIFLLGDLRTTLRLYPQDATQYTSLSKGSNITLPFTATEPTCLCLVGNTNNIEVVKNGTVLVKDGGETFHPQIRHCILYLKKGDVVTGTISSGFKINYNY